jgi:diacylglycerol kinase family enzyme
MCDFLGSEREQMTDYIIICGGDGTINVALQCLMKCKDGTPIPPIAIVRSGTANDLAHEIGISHRIDHAVRNIFEGVVKNIDVIELTSGSQKAYMLTNGGLGLPALAADLANKFRSNLQTLSTCPKSAKAFQYLAKKSYHMVKKMGPTVYSMMTAEAIRTWKQEGWGLEIQIPGKVNVETQSPIVLINNQQSIGASFLPAPFTSNTDGTVNLLLSETKDIPGHTMAAYHIRRGTVESFPAFKSFELKEFSLKSQNPGRSLTFFGDGEILLRDVQEISVRCIHRGLPVMVRQ